MRGICRRMVVQPHRGIEQALLALHARGHGEAPARIEALRVALEMIDGARRLRIEPHAGDLAGDVAHVMPAQQAAAVAQAVRAARIGVQQQPRRFQSAACEHEMVGDDARARRTAGYHDAADMLAVVCGFDIDAGRAQQQLHGGIALEPVAIAAREIRFAAPALQIGGDHVARLEACGDGAAGRFGGEAIEREGGLAAIGVLAGARVVGRQLFVTDRPGGVGRVVACFEVDRIERDAAPAPQPRGTAERAPHRVLHRRMAARIGDLGVAHRLCFVLERLAAAFDQHHRNAAPGQFHRAGDAGRP